MNPPIIIHGEGYCDFFRSVEEAEHYAEPIDVRNHEYIAYDSEGRKLELRIEEELISGSLSLGRTTRERVRITQVEGAPAHAEELKNILRTSLQKLKVPVEELLSLEDLIIAGVQRMGFS